MPHSQPIPSPENDTRCGVCGGRVAPGAPCSQCLLRLAQGHDEGEEIISFETLHWQWFGDYQVIEKIARGGMGVVFRAKQLSLDRDVALKMILAGELADQKTLRMFQTEARAAANLHHPNIVQVYDIGEHEMQPYFTMHYVPGGRTISDWARDHRHDHKAVATAISKVARAVAHAHERGVLHRDLKPSNILWDPRDEPMVTDFGLAKVLGQQDAGITFTGQVMGSPSYMAPEQTGNMSGEITTATDVYGIGAVLYEALSGKPPFMGSTAMETLRKVSEEAPPSLAGTVTKDLRTICLKCLQKQPADRYATAAALADDLDRFVRGEPVLARPLLPLQVFWRWAMRKPALAAMMALCLITMATGAMGVMTQWRAAERANAEQAKALAHLRWQEIEQWLQAGSPARAITYLASIVREQPANWQAVMYAMSILDQNAFAIPAGPECKPPAPSTTPARLSPDGIWFATAGADKIVRIWNTLSAQEMAQLPQPANVTALAIGPDSTSLAVARENGDVVIYPDLRTATVRLRRRGTSPITLLQVSSEGHALTGQSSKQVEYWKLESTDALPAAFSLEEDLQGSIMARDGRHILTWNRKELAVWDTSLGKTVLRVSPRQGFRYAAMAANGNRVAVIDGQYFVRLWDVKGGTEFRSIESPLSAVHYLSLDAEGAHVTLAGYGNNLVVHDVASGLPVSPNMEHHYAVMRLAGDPQGARTFSHGMDNVVNVWDASSGRQIMNGIHLEQMQAKVDIAPSADGTLVLLHATGEQNKEESIAVWKSTNVSKPSRHAVEGQRDFDSGSISPDERLGTIGLDPGKRCHVYELSTGKVVLDKPAAGDVYVTLFSPDMTKCYALTANGWLYGWTLSTGEPLWEPNHQPGKIRPAFISPDGRLIVAGHSDGHIRIYDTSTGLVARTLDHPGEVKTLRWAPDNSGRFLSGSTDALAHVWDIHTGALLQTLSGHSRTIIASGWSPDSRLIATASYDSTAIVWDVTTGRPVGQPMPHSTWLSHLEFSPDGLLLATACRDGTTRLWNPLTGSPVSPPLQQGTTCETVRFTRDGATFAVRDHSGFRFWDTATAEPVTVHYPEPASGGLGMDSESYRAIITKDGSRFYLGYSVNEGALWSVAQPRGKAPPWFADFIETLAQLRQGEPPPQKGQFGGLLKLHTLISKASADSFHARWARHLLGDEPTSQGLK